MPPLAFKPFTEHNPGTILTLLNESYKGLAKTKPEYIKEWEKDWIEYDNDIFQHPDTIGLCGFISYSNIEIVGFASYDPRNGYGKQQINEILKRFRKMNLLDENERFNYRRDGCVVNFMPIPFCSEGVRLLLLLRAQ